MLLALILLATPADAPLSAEAATSAVLTTRTGIQTRGPGCYLPERQCIDVARELAGLRARQVVTEDGVTLSWPVALALGVVASVAFAGGIYVGVRTCVVTGWCR